MLLCQGFILCLGIIFVAANPEDNFDPALSHRSFYNILKAKSEENFNVTQIETTGPQFRYVPVTRKGCTKFWVKAKEDAHISLSNDSNFNKPQLRFIIGGWKNTRSAVVVNEDHSKFAVLVRTVNILNPEEFQGFWIKWFDDGEFFFGKIGDYFPYMTYKSDEFAFPINFVGFTCSIANGKGYHNINGTWIIENDPVCPF